MSRQRPRVPPASPDGPGRGQGPDPAWTELLRDAEALAAGNSATPVPVPTPTPPGSTQEPTAAQRSATEDARARAHARAVDPDAPRGKKPPTRRDDEMPDWLAGWTPKEQEAAALRRAAEARRLEGERQAQAQRDARERAQAQKAMADLAKKLAGGPVSPARPAEPGKKAPTPRELASLAGPGVGRKPRRPAPARDEAPDETHHDAAEPDAPHIARVRAMLAGKVVLFIGGVRRPEYERLYQQRLGLKEFRWVRKDEDASDAPLEHEVARPDVALVAVAVRFANTHTGPKVRGFCKKHRKPCVTLKGGYGVDQLAHAVLEQASGRLA